MAFTDWTFLNSGPCTHNAQPYGPGFPAPTVDSGAYARFVSVLPQSYEHYAGFIPSSSTFSGVPATKAIRVQTYLSLTSVSVWPALSVKMTPAPVGYAPAYSLARLNDELRFKAPGYDVTLTTGLGTGWMSLRITVYPIAANVDRIVCERETAPGSGTWSSTFSMASGDITINGNTHPSRYVPWGGSTKNGVIASSNASVGDGLFLDKLQVLLANVPTPL